MSAFNPFRYYIKEKSNVRFEITAETPHKFMVRLPEYDFIKEMPGVTVEFNRGQLLLFLLAYDERQCLEFMEKLYTNMGCNAECIDKLRRNPAFERVQKSV